MLRVSLTIVLLTLSVLLTAGLYLALDTKLPEWSYQPLPKPELRALQIYLNERESQAGPIKPHAKKRIVWANDEHIKTEYSIVYVHGYSASALELQPVMDRAATSLGANLFYTRLTGHGLPGQAMATAKVEDWLNDMGEALEIGRAIGEKVIVVGTSTGATLVSVALNYEGLPDDIVGTIFISPNFAIANKSAWVARLPFARHWLPIIAGANRSWEPINELHAQGWTTSYPTISVIPMLRLVAMSKQIDKNAHSIPALFIYSEEDKVVDAQTTNGIFKQWPHANKTNASPTLTADDDPYAHVIAGDALSPGQNDWTENLIYDWIKQFEHPGSSHQ